MLGLFVTPTVVAIGDALGGAAQGAIAVVGNARLAAALGASREVIPVDLSPRAAKQLRGSARELSAIEPASLAAVVGVDLAIAAGWEDLLRGWSRVVRDGGVIIAVDHGHAHEASRRALCGGLTEIEQRRAGRSVITSALVSHFD